MISIRNRLFIIMGSIFCFSHSLISQPGFSPSFIVTHQNDTIFGTGNVAKNQDYCLFKRFDAKDYTKYYPYEIKAIRIIDGKYYVSEEIEQSNGKMKWYFLEFLVDGEIDLYLISNGGRFFINKENEGLIELKDNIYTDIDHNGKKYRKQDNKYLGYMRLYMSETPELYPKIDKMDNLKQRDLVKLSVEYHKAICNEYECVDYTKDIPDITYKLELITGVTHHNKFYAPQTGLLVHIWSPLVNDKLFIKTGIIYSDKPYWKKDYSGKDEYDYSIKFPFSFQFVLGKKAFKPTIAFGWPTGIIIVSSLQGGFIYSIHQQWEISLSGSVDGLLALPAGVHKELYDNRLGHSINFGIIYKVNKSVFKK